MVRLPDITLPTAGDHLVLLPHAFAARLWRAESDNSSSEVRSVLSWEEWTSSCWARLLFEGLDDRILLNRLQEEHLWAEVIEKQATDLSPSLVPELARLARTGLQRAAQYGVLSRLRSEADTQDSQSFAEWLAAFLHRCSQERLLSPALLDQALAEYLRQGWSSGLSRIQLVDFLAPSPSQEHLCRALTASGVALENSLPARRTQTANSRLAATFSDEADELRSAVQLIAEAASQKGFRTFALVTSEAPRLRPLLEPMLRELLAPELEAISSDLSCQPWNYHQTAPLRQVPLVAAALEVLQWLVGSLSWERIDLLLTSAYFAFSVPGGSPGQWRAELMRNRPLRDTADLGTTLSILRRLPLPALRRLQDTVSGSLARSSRRTYAEWTDQIRRWLRLVSWAETRPLSPAEYRATQDWDRLLDRIATLDSTSRRVTLTRVVQLLLTQSAATGASPVNPQASVQILGLEETCGLAFDFAVVLGATEQGLALGFSQHPLLPQRLQRSLGVSDPQRHMALTSELLQQFASHCDQTVLLASPSADADVAQLTPLAALHNFRSVAIEELLPAEKPSEPVALECLTNGDALPTLPYVDVPHGAEVLSLQAACGFRAFTALRLGAREAQGVALGLDARDAGSLLHVALQRLWQQLGSQDALRALSIEERRSLVNRVTSETLAPLGDRPGSQDAWTLEYLSLLEQRFSSLILDWLKQELTRAPFTIRAQEESARLTLGPIRLKLRPDRVDEVEDGITLVDYKTSYELSCDHWKEARPDAPQLPAYALALAGEDHLRGVAFAQIRPGKDKAGWISLSEASEIFPKNKNSEIGNLEEQLDGWNRELTQLATAFAAGHAFVNPKAYPKTCQFCAYRTLCRLDPSELLAQAPETAETSDGEHASG